MTRRAWLVCLMSVLALGLDACAHNGGPNSGGNSGGSSGGNLGSSGNRPASGDLLVPPTEALNLGFWPLWCTDLEVPRSGTLTAATLTEDQLLVAEAPSGLVTSVSVKDGALRWRQEVGSPTDRVVALLSRDKRLIVVTESRLYFLEPIDGKILKISPLDQGVSTAPVLAGDFAIFGGVSGRVFAHDLTSGLKRWEYQMGGRITVNPASLPTVLFVIDDAGNMAMLSTAKGDLLWRSRAFAGATAAPVLTNTTVYIASLDHSLYAIERTAGKDRWVYRTEEPLTNAPFVTASHVLLPLPSGALVSLDPANGHEQWRADARPTAVLPLGQNLLLNLGRQLQIMDPATGKARTTVSIPEGVKYLLVGPGGSLIVIAPNGRIAKLDPRS